LAICWSRNWEKSVEKRMMRRQMKQKQLRPVSPTIPLYPPPLPSAAPAFVSPTTKVDCLNIYLFFWAMISAYRQENRARSGCGAERRKWKIRAVLSPIITCLWNWIWI
jgi:hypothetical protein